MVEPLLQVLEDDVSMKCLGREENFRKFERYFLNQISQKGYHAVLQSYPDDRAGYLHGLIHIGLALEFRQPLLLAEGLAQAAVHHYMYKKYLTSTSIPRPENIQANGPWTTKWCTMECSHAKPELLRLAARWRVDPNDLDRATAELINVAVYITTGALLSPYRCMFDFYLLHCLTVSVAHASFLKETSKTNSQKAHLLEYSGRVFMMTYAGMGCPPLRLDYLCSL
ncbi:hypothetical protein EYZ11_005661 [Aspergillus tanneri]|uniref:Uncharacterized protein n=1 Tax=Aspergillus tanneri TaxID=1220188 RepID=A0A4S3JHX6_9EURO|nr:hypothetical protein EYZ11_005661 [Aspergillus tanneri]